ncbi:NADPH-dependent FMN reductase [Streptomyces sirii]|uniref:NADPH-dependent FMN reductase n=1 Tax=Streptomyces sirii TaxID=3127701 RepID=UPI003D36ED5C
MNLLRNRFGRLPRTQSAHLARSHLPRAALPLSPPQRTWSAPARSRSITTSPASHPPLTIPLTSAFPSSTAPPRPRSAPPRYRHLHETHRPLRQPASPLVQRGGTAFRPRLLGRAGRHRGHRRAAALQSRSGRRGHHSPAPVAALRKAVAAADALLLVSPEYAHGVPGVLKNALDWLVSSGECVHKPVAVLTASPFPTGGGHANAQLRETLRMMTGEVVTAACREIPAIGPKIDAATERVTDEPTLADLATAMAHLAAAVTAPATPDPA